MGVLGRKERRTPTGSVRTSVDDSIGDVDVDDDVVDDDDVDDDDEDDDEDDNDKEQEGNSMLDVTETVQLRVSTNRCVQ